MIVGDVERERAVSALREHFVRGRIGIEELGSRTERALVAGTRADLRGALAGLPASVDALELAARGRAVAHRVVRGAVLVVFTGAYLLFSFLLLLVLGITLLVHGASPATLVAFLAVWLVPTFLLSRLWRRRPS